MYTYVFVYTMPCSHFAQRTFVCALASTESTVHAEIEMSCARKYKYMKHIAHMYSGTSTQRTQNAAQNLRILMLNKNL